MSKDQKVVTPYDNTEGKKVQVTNMFNKIAPYYDFLNRVLTVGIDTIWRTKAIRTLEDLQPNTLLDIATGTGDLGLEAYKQYNPNIKVTGLDISDKMIELANKKIKKKGLSDHFDFMVGDSENLPFESNTFDALTVGFGVRNFENLKKGLSEMKRVVKPNGKLVILELSRPTLFPFKQIFNLYFKYILPFVGRITSKDPKAYKYLYESVQAFPSGKDFVNILDELGYKDIECKPLALGICSIYTGIK